MNSRKQFDKRSSQWDRRTRDAHRDGVAAVEFAVIAPVFLILVLGMAEMSRALDVSANLSSAIREGGRLASMHHNGAVPSGWTTEQKVLEDIRNIITANGTDGDNVTLTLTHADGANQGQPFDLDDPNNEMQYFRITASVDYGDVSSFPIRYMKDATVSRSIVFRLGQASLIDN